MCCCNITSLPPKPLKSAIHLMALYDSVVANVAGSEEKMERIKDRAGSKTGPIEAQRQHV